MMNDPTNRAIRAKVSRNVLKKPMSLLDVALVLGGDLGAGEHLDLVGDDLGDALDEPARRSRRPSATTLMASTFPGAVR